MGKIERYQKAFFPMLANMIDESLSDGDAAMAALGRRMVVLQRLDGTLKHRAVRLLPSSMLGLMYSMTCGEWHVRSGRGASDSQKTL